MAYVISLLISLACLCGTAVWDQRHPCCASFQSFADEQQKVFDRSSQGRKAARALVELNQGTQSVADYSIEFWTLAASCNWNEEAQWDLFLHGLVYCIKDELYALDLPKYFDGLLDLAFQVDACLHHHLQVIRHAPVQ